MLIKASFRRRMACLIYSSDFRMRNKSCRIFKMHTQSARKATCRRPILHQGLPINNLSRSLQVKRQINQWSLRRNKIGYDSY